MAERLGGKLPKESLPHYTAGIDRDKELENEFGEGDFVDGLPDKTKFTTCDSLITIFSAKTFILDVGSDCYLVYFYYSGKNYYYSGLTLFFVIFPALVQNIMSIKWMCEEKDIMPKVPRKIWIIRIVMHMLMLGCAYRYLECIYYGWKSRKAPNLSLHKYYYKIMTHCEADASLLRLLEAFMESAPQLVLQLYILLRNAQLIRYHIETAFSNGMPSLRYPSPGISSSMIGQEDAFLGVGSEVTVIIQGLSVSISLLSISWSLTSYARSNRFDQTDKNHMTLPSTLVHFLWHFFTVFSRLLAVALFASVFSFWAIVPLIIRWLVMSTWVCFMDTNVCGKGTCMEYSFDMIVGLVYLFAYLNINDEPSQRKYLGFYTWEFMEDTILVALWAFFVENSCWFYYPALAGHFLSFFVGLALMFLYYCHCHPNGPRKDLGLIIFGSFLSKRQSNNCNEDQSRC